MVAPATITVYDTIYDTAGNAMSGVTVTCVLNGNQETTSGGLLGPRQQSTQTVAGRFAFTVVCNDLLSPSGSTYTISTPFRSYDIAPQSANGSSQQTTAANVIVNVPTALQTIPSLSGTYSGPADFAIRSLTLFSSGSYAPNLPGDATTLTPAGVATGKFWDYGGMSYNVMAAGVKADGVTDDTAKIRVAVNAAAAVNGIADFPPGVYATKGKINPTGGVTMRGAIGGTILRAIPTFADTTLIEITSNTTAIEGFYFQTGTSATYSSNIAIDCLTIKGANNVWVDRCIGYYQNGWFINAIPNGTANPFGLYINDIYNASGKRGIHIQGQSVGAYSVGAELTNVFLNHMQAGDALFLDSVHDVISEGFFGVLDSGANAFNCIHMNDNCAGIFFFAADCGGIAGGGFTGTAYNIAHGAGTRANNIQFIGGITSAQGIGASIDCDDFTMESHTVLQSQTDGIQIIGAGTNLSFLNNRVQQSNLSAGTGYDVNCTNTTGRITHQGDFYESTAVTASMFAQTNVYVKDTFHAHATTPWANATPHHRGNTGPGMPTAPSTPAMVPSTNAQVNNRGADVVVYVTAGASTCAITVNGAAVATLPAAGVGAFSVPDGFNIIPTYASAPTWVWQFAGVP